MLARLARSVGSTAGGGAVLEGIHAEVSVQWIPATISKQQEGTKQALRAKALCMGMALGSRALKADRGEGNWTCKLDAVRFESQG